VVYNANKRASKVLRTYVCGHFALWHIAKMLFDKVWSCHMHTILGPAFKFVFPERSSTCVSFRKMQMQAAFMMDLWLAYDTKREDFIPFYRDRGDEPVVKHLQHFFEFYLPVVSDFFSTRCALLFRYPF
jgi:hypothetical protein